jgi:CRP-like cAMP-binding protein
MLGIALRPKGRKGLSMLGFLHRRKETPRLGTLQQAELFSTLSRSELQVVDGLLHDRRFLKGEIIFDQGEEGQALHVVIAGRVLICRQGEPDTGRFREIDAGGAFGELALLVENAPRSLQARAAEDCVLASLSRGDLESLLDTHAVIASKILLQFARHLGRLLIEISARVEGKSP